MNSSSKKTSDHVASRAKLGQSLKSFIVKKGPEEVQTVAKGCLNGLRRRSVQLSLAALDLKSSLTRSEEPETPVTIWESVSKSKRSSKSISISNKDIKGKGSTKKVFAIQTNKTPVPLGPKAASETQLSRTEPMKLETTQKPPIPKKPNSLSFKSLHTPPAMRPAPPSSDRDLAPATLRNLIHATSPLNVQQALRAEECKIDGILDQLSKIMGENTDDDTKMAEMFRLSCGEHR
ncbi:hypothetical protein PROFUN_14299 [Planoprotostelium fungivorum]|uniref:Uncharacterized protein n=1 Tax=Planoprotostelium fungivorum TaxID=1890364 RepID=A0A2P6N0J3_9EUKA|nr:hypothetical protein PROFUN_14299 [Planoprotostelium fungivorum]